MLSTILMLAVMAQAPAAKPVVPAFKVGDTVSPKEICYAGVTEVGPQVLLGVRMIHEKEILAASTPEAQRELGRKMIEEAKGYGQDLVALDSSDTLRVLRVYPGFQPENPNSITYRVRVAQSPLSGLVGRELYLFQLDLEKPKKPARRAR